MKKLTLKLCSAALIITLGACQQMAVEQEKTANSMAKDVTSASVEMTAQEQTAVDKLLWLETADASADASKALLAAGKPVLLAFSGRGKTHPGLTPAQYEQVKDVVSSEYVAGMGDVIFGDTHKAMRKRARAYTKAYNAVIFETVSAK